MEWTEDQLGQEIVRLHDLEGRGFRVIARLLRTKGIKTNKDKVNGMYNTYMKSSESQTEKSKSLNLMREHEAKVRACLLSEKEEEEVKKQLIVVFVERKTLTYPMRKELFNDKEKLLKFARKVMRVTDPLLWDQFEDHCREVESDLACAVAIALGKQADYEGGLVGGENRRQRFDLYLQDRLRAALNKRTWCNDEAEKPAREEQEPAEESRYEIVAIPVDVWWETPEYG